MSKKVRINYAVGVRAQAELYHQLRLRNVQVEVEYRLKASDPRSRQGWFAADLAVLAANVLTAIVEAKPYPGGPAAGTRQRENYRHAGVPAFWVCPYQELPLATFLANWLHGLAPLDHGNAWRIK